MLHEVGAERVPHLLDAVRRAAVNLPGADIRVAKQQMGPPVGAAVSIEISGEDYTQLAALNEIKRVLKPGGEIRLLEYTWSQDPKRRRIQKIWEPWVNWAYGAGFDRETHRFVREAGFRDIAAFRDLLLLLLRRVGGRLVAVEDAVSAAEARSSRSRRGRSRRFRRLLRHAHAQHEAAARAAQRLVGGAGDEVGDALHQRVGQAVGHRLKDEIGLVPVLRAGLGMVEGIWEMMPSAEVWHIGLFRDERVEVVSHHAAQANVRISLDDFGWTSAGILGVTLVAVRMPGGQFNIFDTALSALAILAIPAVGVQASFAALAAGAGILDDLPEPIRDGLTRADGELPESLPVGKERVGEGEGGDVERAVPALYLHGQREAEESLVDGGGADVVDEDPAGAVGCRLGSSATGWRCCSRSAAIPMPPREMPIRSWRFWCWAAWCFLE